MPWGFSGQSPGAEVQPVIVQPRNGWFDIRFGEFLGQVFVVRTKSPQKHREYSAELKEETVQMLLARIAVSVEAWPVKRIRITWG